jgi:hypothetical protein
MFADALLLLVGFRIHITLALRPKTYASILWEIKELVYVK